MKSLTHHSHVALSVTKEMKFLEDNYVRVSRIEEKDEEFLYIRNETCSGHPIRQFFKCLAKDVWEVCKCLQMSGKRSVRGVQTFSLHTKRQYGLDQTPWHLLCLPFVPSTTVVFSSVIPRTNCANSKPRKTGSNMWSPLLMCPLSLD